MNITEPLSLADRSRLRTALDALGRGGSKTLAQRVGVSPGTVERAAAGGALVRAVRRVLVLELDALAPASTHAA